MKRRLISSRRSRACTLVAVIALVTGLAAIVSPPAGAVSANQSTLVSAVPAKYTPNINNGIVYAITQVGSTIVVGGSFTSATPYGASSALTRNRILAFDQSTGAMSTTFAPSLDGTVNTVIPGPTANTVYVGGSFTNVGTTKSKGLALLNLSDGSLVKGFKNPGFNGVVNDLRLTNGHLFVVGGFTTAGTTAHAGIVSLTATTGAVESYIATQLTGHHSYNGVSGASGPVGGRALDVSPDGTRAIVVGNFKYADGIVHDQIVMLDLGSAAATVDANWNTLGFTAPCASNAFDTYVEDVDFSPDGSYFAIAATGGSTFSTNTDGSRSLCDSATRWSTTDTGTNVQPTWVDYTGNDTFWSVAVTGTAVYVGGHQRWLNNPTGSDRAAEGAVPRPGIVALDPVNGLPFSWNPGRNPRGAGAYALLATNQGLYVGSDTDYFGNYAYKRMKIGFFPLAGGKAPASTSTATLPSNVYEAGPLNTAPDSLTYHAMSGSQVGPTTTVANNPVAWSSTRAPFTVGNSIFYGTSGGSFYKASFDGTTVGTPTLVDPYDDPAWDNVRTGSGSSLYQGVKSDYYGEIPSLTGQFYYRGRLYYTMSGRSGLRWRYFTPDSGIVGGTETLITTADFSNVAGITISGDTLYYANKNDGTLHTMAFNSGTPDPTTDATVSTPGVDWRARGLFLYGSPTFPNQPPTASATATCTGASCHFDGTASADADGSIASYRWNFGDGSTGVGSTVDHNYLASGVHNVSLTVTDNQGASTTWTGTATSSATGVSVGFVGGSDYIGQTTSAAVTAPAGISAGDTELLIVSANIVGTAGTPTGLAGWTQIAKVVNSSEETDVYQRTAQAGDSGGTVTIPLSQSTKVDVQFLDYSGVATGAVPVQTNVDANAASHVAPAITVADSRSWVLNYWSDRSSTTTAWTLPGSVTARKIAIKTGGGAVSGVVADSNASVNTNAYPAQTATANSTSGRANMLSIVLRPGN